MAEFGLTESFTHPENGMIETDMKACVRVASELDEVIIFRSTGPWSRRWIRARYPTKNFHVKGKSSDWGPQAGFVPYLGIYSKVGADATKAKDGTAANDDGLKHHYADKTQLALTMDELRKQATDPEEQPPRLAIQSMEPVPDSKDYFLFALRSGDNKRFAFRAVWSGGTVYHIFVYPERLGVNPGRLVFEKPDVFEVMTSSEVGAGNRPMTGDYDLMAVCPKWADYGNSTLSPISKPGLVFANKGAQPGLTYDAGVNLDKVLDMRSNTGARPADGDTKKTYQGLTKRDGGKLDEHGDMGNLTPRILRCINALNAAMGDPGPLRRVHHNAESHRNHIFGALTALEMTRGDGLPLTVFQPRALLMGHSPTSRYQDVCTLETFQEFREYATLLNQAGYFVPRNWTWGMSVRDNRNETLAAHIANQARLIPSRG
ncbi:MAG: anthrax toxin-like adenylyl cyclase domain-containing protein [Terriglobia bacterium]